MKKMKTERETADEKSKGYVQYLYTRTKYTSVIVYIKNKREVIKS